MRVGICAIGTEMLLGDQVDTNSVWLSKRITEVGGEVVAHVAAGDDLDDLVPTLRWLVDRCDAVVTCGGLGPTQDDLTREAVAALAGVDLREREELVEALLARFMDMGRPMPPRNRQQARIPEGALAYPALGTAPGFQLDVPRSDGGTCMVACVPGVPWEMKGMAQDHVLPALLARGGQGASVTRTIHVTGSGESTVAARLAELSDRLDTDPMADLSYLASAGAVRVRLTVRGDDVETARAASQPLVDEVCTLLGQAVASVDDERIEDVLVRELRTRGETVATCESATAGALAARLAGVPGASNALRGALVTYATDTKHALAGVDADLLARHGPVSVEVTEALAVRAREVVGADWGVGVTGVAGPDPQDGQEVGTVTAAVAGPDGRVTSRRVSYPGDRAAVQSRLVSLGLELLRRELLGLGEGRG